MSVIEISRLTKTYGPVRAVDEFSLSADKGEIVALVGPDGAGKTTIFRAACGLINFDSGEIRIAGLDISKDFEKVKPHLGYMPQVFSLYPDLSVEENLDFYAGLFGVRREELRRKKQTLYEFSGLGPFRGRRASELSGGMRQKLSLSCTLVHNPDVFILDEPTTGVDPISRQQFWSILKDLRSGGSSILVSTPYMDEVAIADRAIFVFGGRTLGAGAPAELAKQFKGHVYRISSAIGADTFQRLSKIEGVTARWLGSSVYFYTGARESIEGLYDSLNAAGVSPGIIEEAEPSLEDAFVQLMGK